MMTDIVGQLRRLSVMEAGNGDADARDIIDAAIEEITRLRRIIADTAVDHANHATHFGESAKLLRGEVGL